LFDGEREPVAASVAFVAPLDPVELSSRAIFSTEPPEKAANRLLKPFVSFIIDCAKSVPPSSAPAQRIAINARFATKPNFRDGATFFAPFSKRRARRSFVSFFQRGLFVRLNIFDVSDGGAPERSPNFPKKAATPNADQYDHIY
jgi:hypothetical protein